MNDSDAPHISSVTIMTFEHNGTTGRDTSSNPNISAPRVALLDERLNTTSETDLIPERFCVCLPVEKDYYQEALNNRSHLGELWNGRNKWLSTYIRLFATVLFANVVGIVSYLLKNRSAGLYSAATPINSSAINILLTVLIRQEYIVNTLYKSTWYIPHSWPLSIRYRIVKFYEHGGMHAATAISGTAWLVLLTIVSGINYSHGAYNVAPLLGTCIVIVVILFSILIPAIAALRFRYHDVFEISHRFGGWIAVALFWVEVGLYIHLTAITEQRNPGLVLLSTPSFWLSLAITFHIILPWIKLRKLSFTPTILSHKAVRLDFVANYPRIAGIGLSLNPLFEWHSFATYPRPKDGPNQHSVIVSKAGDWTRHAVSSPSNYYWVKGIPKTGLLSTAMMFDRVVIVTTGSGIAPVISMTLSDYHRARRTQVIIIWSAPNPEAEYGRELVDDVLNEHWASIVWDTRKQGRPDLVKLAYNNYKRHSAEAIFVISNRELTRNTITSLEALGLPAFGPIWDS